MTGQALPSTSSPNVDILFDQKKCLVVNKPGGVLTQGPPGIDSMELRIKKLFKSYQPADSTKKIYAGVPHRLDRPVSGVMVFGKNKLTTRALSAQFQKRDVRKVYWAVVQGIVPDDGGTWKDTMRKLPDQAKSEITTADHPESQHAELSYQVIARSHELSWLQIELGTGRTHQIRLQTSSRGFPILGDQLYGSPTPFGPQTADLRARWISLHARRLEFTIPETEKRVQITAPVPDAWKSLAAAFPDTQVDDFHLE